MHKKSGKDYAVKIMNKRKITSRGEEKEARRREGGKRRREGVIRRGGGGGRERVIGRRWGREGGKIWKMGRGREEMGDGGYLFMYIPHNIYF